MASSHLPTGHAPGTQRAGTAPQNAQRGFARVKLGGRHRPIKFSYNAVCHFCDLENLSTAALENLDGDHTKPGHIRALLFAGFCEGARVSGEPLVVKEGEGDDAAERPADLYDVGDWIGADQQDNDGANVERAMDLFSEAQAEDDEEDEGDDAAPLETAPKANGAASPEGAAAQPDAEAAPEAGGQKLPESTPDQTTDGSTS